MAVSKQERSVTALRTPKIYYSSRGGRRVHVVAEIGPAVIHFDVAPDGAVNVNYISAGKTKPWRPRARRSKSTGSK